MTAVEVMDGEVVRRWFLLAADALGKTSAAIDLLNVFPIPDADTGTNLHRTLVSAAEAVAALPPGASPADLWQAGTAAALRGACGNSGIIVSQLLRGLADICGPAVPCDGAVVAAALANAAAAARAAVRRPVEGTVLTVADAAARAAARATGLAEVSREAARGARAALARTEEQLEVLAASGVVDAGGAGLCVVLDALSAAVTGLLPDAFEVPPPARRTAASPAAPGPGRAGQPLFEVTFLLDAPGQAAATLADRLDEIGDSLVVSGSDPQWHVHVHAPDAGAVIEAALAAGLLSKITVTYLNGAQSPIPAGRHGPAPALVMVADGAGLAGLLRQAGAEVVDGGPAAAPAAALAGLAALAGPSTLVAPADLAGSWPPGWPVVEVASEVQAVAAAAVHDRHASATADAAAMRRAVAAMRCGAVRAAGGVVTGVVTGVTGAGEVARGSDQAAVAAAVVGALVGEQTELVTVLTGQGADHGLGDSAAATAAALAPGADVLCYDGGMAGAVLLVGAE